MRSAIKESASLIPAKMFIVPIIRLVKMATASQVVRKFLAQKVNHATMVNVKMILVQISIVQMTKFVKMANVKTILVF